MARTLSQLLQDVNAFVALDNAVPIGTDADTWSNYANQAVMKASANGRMPQFHMTQVTATGGGDNSLATRASISLPSNFREFEVAPRVDLGGGVFEKYEEIKPIERFERGINDKYCYVLGNPSGGYTAVFNRLTANATLHMDFQRFPSGFATLTDTCELDDDTFVVEQTKSYVLQARSDDRFPIVEANANRLLQNMVGRQSRTPGGGRNSTPRVETYRIGE